MQRIYLLTIYITTLLILGSCKENNPKKEIDATSISKELNDAAMQIQMRAKDSNDLIQSLYYLDQAIEADSMNLYAYSNKINVLLELKKEQKALQTLQLVNTRKPTAEFVMFEGFIHDKLKDSSQALIQYQKAIKLYDDQF